MKKLIFLITAAGIIMGCAGCSDKPETVVNRIVPSAELSDDTHLDKVKTEATFDLDKTVPESASEFVLNELFTDNMMLQANKAARVWGGCATDGGIALAVGDSVYYGTVSGGKFSFYIGKTDYTSKTDIVFYNSKAKRTLKNVAFGELFLAGGQSNMEFKMSGNPEFEDIISVSLNPDIRLTIITNSFSDTPRDALSAKPVMGWREAAPDSVRQFSAVGYFFAAEFNRLYGVPVGVVDAAVSNTRMYTWMPEEEFADSYKDHYVASSPNFAASKYFNGMISPLKQMTFRSVLWYQGETEYLHFSENLKLLISGWRRELESENLFFAVVQLPRFTGEQQFFTAREEQRKAVIDDPHAAYSVNIDLGTLPKDILDPSDVNGIHPLDKDKVGLRLAHTVAQYLFNAKGHWRGPVLREYKITGSGAELTFDTVGNGLELKHLLGGFEVAGADKEYETATPEIKSHDTIKLTSGVKDIRYIRYGYSNKNAFVTGDLQSYSHSVSLYNSFGYPAEQFIIIK